MPIDKSINIKEKIYNNLLLSIPLSVAALGIIYSYTNNSLPKCFQGPIKESAISVLAFITLGVSGSIIFDAMMNYIIDLKVKKKRYRKGIEEILLKKIS